MIGLKRGAVVLCDHKTEWEENAAQTIQQLFTILGDVAVDIQHVGSTAITSIKAKPIIDIAVAVRNFDEVIPFIAQIETAGYLYRPEDDENWKLYFVRRCDNETTTTHHIHIVRVDDEHWKNFVLFRNFLNKDLVTAQRYETIKLKLMDEYGNNRLQYTKGKHDFVIQTLQLANIWDDFERTFTNIEPITKGWSEDKKYCVTKADGTKYLLRISPIERYETRKALFDMLLQVAALDIPMCKPVEFGTCTDGVYSLQTWIDGSDAEDIIPLLTDTEQYLLGVKSGEILRKIHSIPAPENQEDWYTRFNRKTNNKIEKYRECPLCFEGDDKIIAYIEQNRDLLKNRPQCFQHGDYHIGNMMLQNGELVIIDFDRFDFGDPWEEFNRIVWCAFDHSGHKKSPHFATGQLNGYFGGSPSCGLKPPLDFFKLLAFYIGSNMLSSIYWAIPFGQSEIDTMMKQSQDVLAWYDNMKNPVPTWYLKDFYIQYIDGIPFKLKSPFDFTFLHKYGKVFKVFDDQDSGNICFGMEKDEQRYFVKFAGAPTEQYNGTPEAAIERLKSTIPIYKELSHPNLIKFINAEEIGGGFAMIFLWAEGECMGRMYPLSRQKFMQMPLSTRIQVFEDILTFHAYVAKQGYVAIDFYDGSVMYDFQNCKTTICDIDFYAKIPYINEMGRMWGSSRFMSPEEYRLGADIDEVTNVYTMGAMAFALFSDYDRSIEKWTLSKRLFEVVNKAVSEDKNERQQSIREVIEEWRLEN